MSFWSAAVFYRPGPPPTLTLSALAAFLDDLDTCPALRAKRYRLEAKVKHGRRIDGRVRPLQRERVGHPPLPVRLLIRLGLAEVPGAVVTMISDLKPHLHLRGETVGELAAGIRDARPGPLGRAEVKGDLGREACIRLQSPESVDNDSPFRPDSWGFTAGPVELHSLGMPLNEPVRAGWLGLRFSGPGYFYPESFREWLDRCADLPEVRAATDLCRRHFPASSDPPDPATRRWRTAWAEGAPAGGVDAPLDWCWGPAEG